MSVPFYGDYDTTETIVIPFNTFDSNDPQASATITNLANTDIHIHKDGGTTQRSSSSGVTVSIDFDTITGNHICTIDLSDNTDAGFYANGSQYQVRMEGTTVDAGTVNAWIGAFSIGRTLRPTTAGRTLDVTATGAAGIDWGNVENQTTSVNLSSTTTNLCNTITTYTGNTVQTGDSFARLGAPAGASVSADIATVDTNVDTINTNVGTPSNLGGGATLSANNSDMAGATFSSATDSQEAIRDRGDAAWTTGAGGSDRLLMVDTTIATLATQTSFTLTAGSADDDAYNNCTIVIEDVSTSTQKDVGMVLDYVGSTKTITLKEAPVFTIATTDKVYILAENALKSTVKNRQLDVTATGAAGIDWANVENPTTAVDLSATDIQLCDTVTTNTDMRGTDSAALASVCTEARLSELDAATGGKMANQVDIIQTDTTTDIPAQISGLNDPTAAAIADAVLDEALAGHVTAGTLGKAVADIETDTNELQTDWVNGGRLDLLVDQIITDIAALNNLSAAQVNAEVVDALATDTYAESSGVPAATASLAAKIQWLATLARNKITQTSTTQTVRNDADSADVATSTHSDSAGTYTRGEWV